MREKKYYKIRVDVFWMIVICVVTFVIAKNYGKIRLPKQEKNETDIIKNSTCASILNITILLKNLQNDIMLDI